MFLIKILLPHLQILNTLFSEAVIFPDTLKVANLTNHNVIIPLQGAMYKNKTG